MAAGLCPAKSCVAAGLRPATSCVAAGSCPNLLAEAQLYRYAEAGGAEAPLAEHNHALDALRYLVATLDAHHLARPRRPQPDDAPPESPATPGAAARRPARDPWLRFDNDALWRWLT